jgi:hypothetical protein
VYDQRYLILYGGAQWNKHSWVNPFHDVHAYDIKTNRWTQLSTSSKNDNSSSNSETFNLDTLSLGNPHEGNTFVLGAIVGHHLVLLGGGSSEAHTVSYQWTAFDLISRRWTPFKPSCIDDEDIFIGRDSCDVSHTERSNNSDIFFFFFFFTSIIIGFIIEWL